TAVSLAMRNWTRVPIAERGFTSCSSGLRAAGLANRLKAQTDVGLAICNPESAIVPNAGVIPCSSLQDTSHQAAKRLLANTVAGRCFPLWSNCWKHAG